MASKESQSEEDNELRGRLGKGRRRKRHMFTKEDLEILNESFEQDPYPDFTGWLKLANTINCNLRIIENWFQNKRSRLSPRKKLRIYAARSLDGCPIPGRPPLGYQNFQLPSPQVSAAQTSHGQKSPLGKASSHFYTHKPQSPSKQDGSRESVVTDIKTEPSNDLENGGGVESEPCFGSGQETY